MSLQINDTNRLTKDELEDYRVNSGITNLQYEIIKRRYFDPDVPTVVAICLELNISAKKYNSELNKALLQIYKYEHKKPRK